MAFRERPPIVIAVGDGLSPQSPGLSCSDILRDGFSSGDGLYWLDSNGGDPVDAQQVPCDMSTDGGGWTVCARQEFGSANQYLGNSTLASGVGSATAPHFGANCAQMMKHLASGGSVEFMLKGSATNE